jgi:hypothetical protein
MANALARVNREFMLKLKMYLLSDSPQYNPSDSFEKKAIYAKKRLQWLKRSKALRQLVIPEYEREIGFAEVISLSWEVQAQASKAYSNDLSETSLVDGWGVFTQGENKFILASQLQKMIILNRSALIKRIKRMGAYYEGCIREATEAEIEFINKHNLASKNREPKHELIALQCVKNISEKWLTFGLPVELVHIIQTIE